MCTYFAIPVLLVGAILKINISQGSVAMIFRCGKIFNGCQLSREHAIKRILKIDHYLAKSLVAHFYGPRCIVSTRKPPNLIITKLVPVHKGVYN